MMLPKLFHSQTIYNFLADGEVAAEGSPKQLLASKLPFVKQFIHSEKDGPVPFHAEAPSYQSDLAL